MLVVKQILTSQRKQMIKIHPNMKNLLLLVAFISLCTGLKAQSDDRGYLVKTGDMAPRYRNTLYGRDDKKIIRFPRESGYASVHCQLVRGMP